MMAGSARHMRRRALRRDRLAVFDLWRVFPGVVDDLDVHVPVESLFDDCEETVMVELIGRYAKRVAARDA